MRIAQVNNNIRPVDRLATGSIAAHVGMLSDQLVLHNHDVDVYAALGSQTLANVVSFDPIDTKLSETEQTAAIDQVVYSAADAARQGTYDVIHNHVWPTRQRLQLLRELSGYALTCSVLHTMPEGEARQELEGSRDMPFIAFSQAQANLLDINWLGVVHHGIDTNVLRPREFDAATDKALVIGKIFPRKRTHEAIIAARAVGLAVDVAGPILNYNYYFRDVQPLLESDKVTYRGVLGGEEKRRAYAEAAVTVTASRVAETFCLVLAESMSCGTPAVALDSVACPEVIDDGVTGYTVSSCYELPEAIAKAGNLDRGHVRDVAVEKYSVERMARDYERIYRQNV